ncbi:MAG: sel1 repeat family protein [Pseudomonadota bacterium]|nr:sel1 repeat family protein [Pseudomonadota bacterium]
MSISIQAEALISAEPILSGEEMYRLGLAASTGGDDGSFDLINAHKWFNLAAMQGNLEARAYRAELSKEMTPDEIAEAQRLAREYLSTHRPRLHG